MPKRRVEDAFLPSIKRQIVGIQSLLFFDDFESIIAQGEMVTNA